MLRDKPHLGFSVLSIISGLILIIPKYLFTAKTYDNPILYWFDVLLDGIPMLFGSFLFLAITYWFMAMFGRVTHPVLNVLQLVFVLFSYIGIRYVAGSMLNQTSRFPYFSMFDYLMILSPYVSLLILVLNIIYSLVKPIEPKQNRYKIHKKL
jgi:hypothetical protein